MPKIKTGEIQKDVSQIQQSDSPKKRNMPLDPQMLDTLLQTGIQATSTVVGQRAASGKSAARQARIAACGRRPLFGKRRKAEYDKCAAQAQADSESTKSMETPYYGGGDSDSGGNKTMMYVGIGLGVIVVGALGFFLIRKFSK